jgi:hypothetical protein
MSAYHSNRGTLAPLASLRVTKQSPLLLDTGMRERRGLAEG